MVAQSAVYREILLRQHVVDLQPCRKRQRSPETMKDDGLRSGPLHPVLSPVDSILSPSVAHTKDYSKVKAI